MNTVLQFIAGLIIQLVTSPAVQAEAERTVKRLARQATDMLVRELRKSTRRKDLGT